MSMPRVFSMGLVSMLICLGLGADCVRAEGRIWTSDFAAARAKAKAEKKSLLVDFTGSDWCMWCKRLHAEVFDKDVFKPKRPSSSCWSSWTTRMRKSFPMKSRPRTTTRQGVQDPRYPTVLMMDAEGYVIAPHRLSPKVRKNTSRNLASSPRFTKRLEMKAAWKSPRAGPRQIARSTGLGLRQAQQPGRRRAGLEQGDRRLGRRQQGRPERQV